MSSICGSTRQLSDFQASRGKVSRVHLQKDYKSKFLAEITDLIQQTDFLVPPAQAVSARPSRPQTVQQNRLTSEQRNEIIQQKPKSGIPKRSQSRAAKRSMIPKRSKIPQHVQKVEEEVENRPPPPKTGSIVPLDEDELNTALDMSILSSSSDSPMKPPRKQGAEKIQHNKSPDRAKKASRISHPIRNRSEKVNPDEKELEKEDNNIRKNRIKNTSMNSPVSSPIRRKTSFDPNRRDNIRRQIEQSSPIKRSTRTFNSPTSNSKKSPNKSPKSPDFVDFIFGTRPQTNINRNKKISVDEDLIEMSDPNSPTRPEITADAPEEPIDMNMIETEIHTIDDELEEIETANDEGTPQKNEQNDESSDEPISDSFEKSNDNLDIPNSNDKTPKSSEIPDRKSLYTPPSQVTTPLADDPFLNMLHKSNTSTPAQPVTPTTPIQSPLSRALVSVEDDSDDDTDDETSSDQKSPTPVFKRTPRVPSTVSSDRRVKFVARPQRQDGSDSD